MRTIRIFLLAAAIMAALASTGWARHDPAFFVKVVVDESSRRVNVTVGGQPFTAYIWPDVAKKPVLYPLRASTGTIVTRGYPLDPQPGERHDHPHHIGLWFNYGNVNGIDFWNHSDAVSPAERAKMGTIYHRKILRTRDGPGSGELEVEMDWTMPDGQTVLKERTLFVFRASNGLRTVDRITRLTALDRPVVFKDDKEGVLGLRVARWLEMPVKRTEVLKDSSGKTTEVAKTEDASATGEYLSSEGVRGDDVWGTRGRWVLLSGRTGNEQVTVAILDHPSNPGFPTYWHARGYGLFAANPLGQKLLSGGKQELNFALGPKQSATFRYRVAVFSGSVAPDRVEAEYRDFAGTKQ